MDMDTNKPAEKVATDADLLMAVAQALRLTSPAVKAILAQREQAATEKPGTAEARETARIERAEQQRSHR